MHKLIAIPGRPGFAALLWWFQGPVVDAERYAFSLDGQPLSRTACRIIPLHDLVSGDGADPVAARTFLLITPHADGPAGAMHTLQVQCGSELSNTARSRTLPRNQADLEIILASCYCADTSRIDADAPLPHQYMNGWPPPHLRINCGDQVYLDLALSGLHPRHDFSGDADPYAQYRQQWQRPDFVAWMAAAPNLCMADDHEFWNNFPSAARLPNTPGLKPPAARVQARMYGAFMLYQASLNADPDALLADHSRGLDHDALRTFAWPAAGPQTLPVSLFMLDTRSERRLPRDKSGWQFCKPAWLQQALDWIAALDQPGLLVTSQSLLELSGDEAELIDCRHQFGALMQAIADSPHQLALLTGDIHWSRAQWLTCQHTRHVEIVSSAVARIGVFDVLESWSALNGKRQWTGSQGQRGELSYERVADTDYSHNFAMLAIGTTPAGPVQLRVQWYGFYLDDEGRPAGHPQLIDRLSPVGDNSLKRMDTFVCALR